MASACGYMRIIVKVRAKSDEQLAAPKVKHRTFDHRRLVQHQRDRCLFVESDFLVVGQLLDDAGLEQDLTRVLRERIELGREERLLIGG